MALRPLPRRFFARDARVVAPELLGKVLVLGARRARLVEVEAYAGGEDPGSHAFRGMTARNATMFGPPGHAYVYRSYGIHWCVNFVCADEEVAAAVLIRALEPTHGLDAMRERRGVEDPRALCSGPGKLCQALAITREHDGLPLDVHPFRLEPRADVPEIVTGPRIGITRATELSWRYALAGSPYVSRVLRRG